MNRVESFASTFQKLPCVMHPNREEQNTIWGNLQPPFWTEGETMYLVDQKWWLAWWEWKRGAAVASPGPIDNSRLIDPKRSKRLQCLTGDPEVYQCKKGISIHCHYTTVTSEQWRALYNWYGGGPCLPRKVCGKSRRCLELYPYVIKIKVFSSLGVRSTAHPHTFSVIFSRDTLLSNVKKMICDRLSLSYRGVKMYREICLEKYLHNTLEKRVLKRDTLLLVGNDHLDVTTNLITDNTSYLSFLPRELDTFYILPYIGGPRSSVKIN